MVGLFSASAVLGTIPHAYVTDVGNNTVRIIDISNDTVQSIFGFVGPRVVKLNPSGKKAFVGCDDNTLRVIDTITHVVAPTAVPVNHPVALAITPDGDTIYVASLNNTVSVIDVPTMTTVAVIPGFNHPSDLKILPNGSKIYATNQGNGTVSIIDPSTYAVVDTITGFQTPVGITLTIDGTFAYITDPKHNWVYVVDTSTNTIVDTILGFNTPSYMAASPDKATMYVSNASNDTVGVLRLSDHFLVGEFTIPFPRSIAVSQDGLFLYVGSQQGAVFKVRTLDHAIVNAIPGFDNPSNIALTNNNAPGLTVNGCQVASPGNIHNIVKWDVAPGSPAEYKIYRDSNFKMLAAALPPATLEFIDSGLLEGQSYSYYVVAEYGTGFSSTIGSVEVTPARTCSIE